MNHVWSVKDAALSLTANRYDHALGICRCELWNIQTHVMTLNLPVTSPRVLTDVVITTTTTKNKTKQNSPKDHMRSFAKSFVSIAVRKFGQKSRCGFRTGN